MISIVLALALSSDAQAVKTRAAGDVQAQVVGADKVTVAPVSTTAPAGTEAGVYVRVVSQPVGGGGGGVAQTQVRSGANAWTDVGYAGGDLNVPVQGSVTANAGSNLNTSALALDATLTSRAQKTQLTDGTRDGTVKAASTLPVATDTAVVVTTRDTVTVSGTVTTTPPSNASTNLAQVAGATVATGNGVAAGAIRVSVASDSTGVLGATESGTWTVQPGNTPNSTPWLTTDSADANTGSALPAKAEFIGVSDSTANLGGVIQCDKSAQASSITTATDTQLVGLVGSTTIYVCSYTVQILGVATTAGSLQLEYGTGTNCATGKVAITPTWAGNIDGTNKTATVVSQTAGLGYLFKTIAGQALCGLSTADANGIKVYVTYAQR